MPTSPRPSISVPAIRNKARSLSLRAPVLAAAILLLAACDAAGIGGGPPAANDVATAVPQKAAPAAPAGTSPEAEFPALTGRVVDEAGLLSEADEARLTAELAELERRTADQLVIVTLRSLRGRGLDLYGIALANHWGIGQADRDNGVLLLVAPAERQARIEVGLGLEAILTDTRAKQILDRDMLPSFRAARWSEGIEAGARSIIATLIEHESALRRGPT